MAGLSEGGNEPPGSLKANNNAHRLDWPAQSPDLNRIEHLWAEMDRRLRSREMRPTSIVQLSTMLQEKWRRIRVDILQTLVESMPDRMAAYIATRLVPRGSKLAKTVPKYFLVDSVYLSNWSNGHRDDSHTCRTCVP
ncbi:hypothetical protein ANN_27175 [Periplaneta americana]|uniref:Tc1-like transposase DDE domain-containing protein n=1 Tax=Periplaneta americana TaxID=6978 RepID=A0ABQ8RXF5_PERAM|nr:hypothetical protein ANN_27175 [Periplaneta americana]